MFQVLDIKAELIGFTLMKKNFTQFKFNKKLMFCLIVQNNNSRQNCAKI